MANVTILDTGYMTVNQTGSQLPITSRFNLGVAMEIKGVSISYELSAAIDNPVLPSNYSGAPVNFVGIGNAKITLIGIANITDSTDVYNLGQFEDLIRTKGIKCIYYNAIDGYAPLTDSFGVSDSATYSSHPTRTHLHVRFTNIQVTQKAENLVRYTLEAVTTL